MATLTGKTIANTYKDLLQVSNSNSGIDATLRDISDGEGTSGPFQLSTTGVRLKSGTKLDSSGGTIENIAIGGITPASGDFTDLSSSNTADFSAAGLHLGGTAAANLFDDFEKNGTFTPGLTAGTSGTITLDTLRDTLSYTKMANVVNIFGRIRVGSVSSPIGTLRLTGLPFTSADLTEFSERSGFGVYIDTLAAAVNAVQCLVIQLSTEIKIEEFDGTNTVDDMANHIQALTDMTFNFSYITAA